jgi:hypothetical protein
MLDERILPLPKYLLPLPACNIGRSGAVHNDNFKRKMAFDETADQNDTISGSVTKKRVMFATSDENIRHPRSSGLSATVQDLIRNYVPSSLEKRPLWCRCCQYQAQSEAEFISHKSSERHEDNVALERKASTCKLCRKQFTSPDQLKEHIKGKSHRDRLESMQGKQRHMDVNGNRPMKFERL